MINELLVLVGAAALGAGLVGLGWLVKKIILILVAVPIGLAVAIIEARAGKPTHWDQTTY